MHSLVENNGTPFFYLPGNDAYALNEKHKKGEDKPINMWAHLPSQSDSWQNEFLSYTDTFQNEIVGILYGHTHMDDVRRIYNSSDTSVITEVEYLLLGSHRSIIIILALKQNLIMRPAKS